jgi:hypothetical protein
LDWSKKLVGRANVPIGTFSGGRGIKTFSGGRKKTLGTGPGQIPAGSASLYGAIRYIFARKILASVLFWES